MDQNSPQPAPPQPATPPPPAKNEVAFYWIVLLLIVFASLSVYIIIEIIDLWPGHDNRFTIFSCAYTLTLEQRMFILVAFGGMLGAIVHIISSFTAFIGNKELKCSWIPWFMLRPFIGAAIALVFYFVFRGGLVSTTAISNPPPQNKIYIETLAQYNALSDSLKIAKDTATTKRLIDRINLLKPVLEKNNSELPIPINPFGLLAVACLAGMFSKRAGKKLEEIFDNIFNVKNQDTLKDNLGGNSSGTAPAIPPPAPQPTAPAGVKPNDKDSGEETHG